jgi:hypothetical protein
MDATNRVGHRLGMALIEAETLRDERDRLARELAEAERENRKLKEAAKPAEARAENAEPQIIVEIPAADPPAEQPAEG